ncbi:MAG TPA: DUF6152 family protein [Gammaproteobacteria bacterium]
MPAKGAGSRPGFIDPQRGPRHADPYHDTGGARRTAIPALPALAHHSNSAYQVDEIITLTGTVKEWRWSNPRTWLLITVEGEDGTEQGMDRRRARAGRTRPSRLEPYDS